jgi:hypothetical protein
MAFALSGVELVVATRMMGKNFFIVESDSHGTVRRCVEL